MTELARNLNTFQMTMYGVGTMVGAGIYVLIGKVAGIADVFSIHAFVTAALVMALSGFSFAQLSVRYPRSGGVTIFVHEAFNVSQLTQLMGILILMTGVVSAATLINGFLGYLLEFIQLNKLIGIVLITAIITFVACRNVSESVNTVVVITLLEIGGLFILILFAPTLPAEQLPIIPVLPTMEALPAILVAAFVASYAFIGFEDMVNMAEEVKNPKSTMIKSILFALAITTCLYVWVAWVALRSLPIEELANSDAPFATILAQQDAWLATAISIISLIAISNGALVQLLMGSRVILGLSREKLIPHWFGQISERTRTPVRATILLALVILVFALALPLITLAKLTSGIILIVFAAVNLSALVVNHRFNGPIWKSAISLLGIVVTLSLLIY